MEVLKHTGIDTSRYASPFAFRASLLPGVLPYAGWHVDDVIQAMKREAAYTALSKHAGTYHAAEPPQQPPASPRRAGRRRARAR